MRTLTRPLAATAGALLLTVPLVGCSAEREAIGSEDSSTAAPSPAADAGVEPLLAEYGWNGSNTAAVVDLLDRLGEPERPRELSASVRAEEVVVSAGDDTVSLPMPADRFYLSVAPYVDRTHDCHYHALTMCTGELAEAEVQVTVVDETNDEVLVEETRTTFANGFTGFWLPRDIEGTLRVAYGDRSGEVDFATDDAAPTCLTTLQLA